MLSAVVLLIPAAPIVAVAVLAVLALVARGKQVRAAAGLPQVDARPDRYPLPLARARSIARGTALRAAELDLDMMV